MFYESFPVLVLIAAMLKYGPARVAFESAVRSVLHKHGAMLCYKSLYQILVGTAHGLDCQSMPQWIRHCGGMGHVLGFLPWLSRLGLIKNTKTSGGCVKLCESGSCRWIAPLDSLLQNRLRRLLLVHDAARACQLRPSRPLLFSSSPLKHSQHSTSTLNCINTVNAQATHGLGMEGVPRLAVAASVQREFLGQGCGWLLQPEVALSKLFGVTAFVWRLCFQPPHVKMNACANGRFYRHDRLCAWWLRSEMRASGIESLEMTVWITKRSRSVVGGLGGLGSPHTQAETIAGFAALFPDQSEWLFEFATLFNAEYVCQLVDRINYNQPMELLTMYLCIFLAPHPHSDIECALWFCRWLCACEKHSLICVHSKHALTTDLPRTVHTGAANGWSRRCCWQRFEHEGPPARVCPHEHDGAVTKGAV